MAGASNERQVVGRIVKAIQAHYPDSWVLKTHGGAYQRTGIPDILACVQGRMVGIEVKHRKPGESMEHMESRVTLIQRREIRKIIKAGGIAGVAYSEESALALIDAGLS